MPLILNHYTALLKYFSYYLVYVRKITFTYRLIEAIALLLTVLFVFPAMS